MNDIKKLKCGLYIVCGRILSIEHNSIDMNTSEGQAEAISLAKSMDHNYHGLPFGYYTVKRIYPKMDGPSGRGHLTTCVSPKWLSPEAREELKKEIPGHDDEF